jgi:hypothetical protein
MTNQINKINADVQIRSSSKNIKTDHKKVITLCGMYSILNNYKNCDCSGSNDMTV